MGGLAWITGAGGLIGSHIARDAPREWDARALTRTGLDLTDFPAVRHAFKHEKPRLIIHCAALSKTLVCERNPEAARLNNIEVTRVLAELASDVPLLFFSTDLVFDGTQGNYTERDTPNPLTVYAETKLAAEQIVLANPKHTVVRTSLNAGRTSNGTAFNEQWRATWRRGETLNLFVDEFRSPIAAEVTARAVWELVAANQPGVYHLAGSERLSRYDLGRLLAASDPQLDVSKVQRLLSFPLPQFSDWLRENPNASAA